MEIEKEIKKKVGRFGSLKIQNYRLYFIGQGISLVGTWMQSVAQNLLMLTLTNSGTALGLVSTLQFLPMLLLGPWAGVWADRLDKKRTLCLTQSLAMLLAFSLGTIVMLGMVKVWMIYSFALLLGCTNLLDNPVRRSFLPELVEGRFILNASTLETVQINCARFIGPLLGAACVATWGFGSCFISNGLSYCVVIATLLMLKRGEMRTFEKTLPAKGQLKEGWNYILASDSIRSALLMTAIIGMFVYEYQVSLALFAHTTFKSNVGYAYLLAASGSGSIISGILTAHREKVSLKGISKSVIGLGISLLVTSLMPNLYLAVICMVVVGTFSVQFISMSRALVQIESPQKLQGRIMVFWSMGFLGSTPIGAPIIGFVGQHCGARIALIVGAVSALGSGLYFNLREGKQGLA